MLFILYFLLFIIFIIAVLFAFPVFSPVPYFPSNKKDLDLIVESLQIRSRQTIVDLGAGDGCVIFEAAKIARQKNLNTKFIAVEINPVLLFIMNIRRLFHPNKKNIKVLFGNMFDINLKTQILNVKSKSKISNLLTFYLYISPWYLDKVISNLKFQIKNFSVVSYMYPVVSYKNIEKKIKGNFHNIYFYVV